jgi:hypothetical protein
MPPMLDANVTASTNKAKARARSCPISYVPKHQTYAASLSPNPVDGEGHDGREQSQQDDRRQDRDRKRDPKGIGKERVHRNEEDG